MDEIYVLAKKAIPLTVRAVALLLSVELAAALLLADGAVLSERLMLRAVAVLVLALLLMPYPDLGEPLRVGQLARWGVLSAAALVAGTILFGVAPVFTRMVWLLAAGTALLVCLFGGISLRLALWLGDRRKASHSALGILMLSLSVPLWLSPIAALFGATRWLVDAVIALSPASYLAALAGIDYLRSDWFYQHTPYGGLRYDYPDPFYLSLGILLSLAIILAPALRRVPESSFSDLPKSLEL